MLSSLDKVEHGFGQALRQLTVLLESKLDFPDSR